MKAFKKAMSFIFATITVFTVSLSHCSASFFFSRDNNTVILPPYTKSSDLKNCIIYDGGAPITDGTVIKTGCQLSSAGKHREVAVLGDVNADGNINSTDYIQLRRFYLGFFRLSDVQLTAADADFDGKITSTDFMRIRNLYLGSYSFTDRPPFSAKRTDNGAIIPEDILSPSLNEIIPIYLDYGKYLNYYFKLDCSNSSFGFFDLSCNMPADTIKSITVTVCKDKNINKFIISNDRLSLPLRLNFCYGNGNYGIKAVINCADTSFTALDFNVNVEMDNASSPFLISAYPTVFDNGTLYVKQAAVLCADLKTDLEKTAACYRYIADTQKYLYTVSTDEFRYLPDLDDIYSRGYGVCWDFCAALAAMLRSQGITSKIEIGYAYNIISFGHAWVSVYIDGDGTYDDEYLTLSGNKWNRLDVTASVCRSDKSAAKRYIESMEDTYRTIKCF